MFSKLSPLITDATTLVVTVARADDVRLRITVTPVTDKEKEKTTPASVLAKINQPVVFTGTPEELEAELPQLLTGYVTKREEAKTTLTTLEAEFEEEKKAAEKRIADEKKKGGKPATAAKPAAPAPPPKPVKPAPEATTAQAALF